MSAHDPGDAGPVLRTMLKTAGTDPLARHHPDRERSEEHTSELQSPCNLVCRLLLEKKKNICIRTLYMTIATYRPVDFGRLIQLLDIPRTRDPILTGGIQRSETETPSFANTTNMCPV